MTLAAVVWAVVSLITQAVVARNTSVQYFGGPLVQRAQVTALFYGDHPYQERMLDFLNFLPQSPLMDLVAADYSTDAYHLVHGALSNHTTLPIEKLDLDDEMDLQPLLRSLLPKRTISYSSNAVFLIFLSPGVSFTHGKSHSCLDICAYHNSLEPTPDIENNSSQRLYYAVIPICNTGCGKSANAFDNLSALTSHEFFETIVNPEGSLAFMDSPVGWTSQTSEEIGDLCNMNHGSLSDKFRNLWTVQKLWSRSHNKCLSHLPILKPAD